MRPRPAAPGGLRAALALGAALALPAACADVRPRDTTRTPDYARDVRPLLEAACARCHAAATPQGPQGDWRYDRFQDAIACAAPAPTDAGVTPDAGLAGVARLARALAREDHRAYLDANARAVVEAWLAAGAPAGRGALHDTGFADPRSPAFHGRRLRASRWAEMLDPTRQDACGRCHEATPARPPGATGGAGNAPACTTCHDRRDGVLACTTCHGQGATAHPPRDPCFHPEDHRAPDPHAIHLRGRGAAGPLACGTCHPGRTADLARGDHGNGVVEVVFDPARAGARASYDRATGTCTVACHDRGGARARPAWRGPTGPLGCTDCHGAPPADHPRGRCSACHAEAADDGASLRSERLHLSNTVDLGDGSGTCAAGCHGVMDNPWPSSGGHAAHRDPRLALPVACGSCHAEPGTAVAPGHLDDALGAEVRFAGLATARGAAPTYDAGRCQAVACHGAGLRGGRVAVPLWTDTGGAARRCGACHGVPPPPPHPTATTCESALCHGGEVAPGPDGPEITAAGRALHMNGVVNVAGGER